MKYLIPVLAGGATITAAITTAVAQAHGALSGQPSLRPYLGGYGVLTIYTTNNLASDLIQFRERFDGFLGGYRDFLRRLNRKRAHPLEPAPFGYSFARPNLLAPSAKTETTV